MEPEPKIRWKTFDELEASLIELERVYSAFPERRKELRRIVIKAKDRARFASRNPKAAAEKRAAKEEMVRWMLVWLGDPAIFADWVKLRRPKLNDPAML